MNKILIFIIIIVFLAAVIFLIRGGFSAKIFRSENINSNDRDTYTYEMNPVYKTETEKFMKYEGQAKIVMLGNSLTSRADWEILLGRKDVLNRGLSGDITEGMLRRLDSVIKVKPAVCFFMGGINDITRKVSYERTLNNIREIALTLKGKGIKPVIQSVLYTESRFFSSGYNNPIVTELNEDLIRFCSKNEIEFLDLNRFMSENKTLKAEYTDDGLHLNAKGYEVWSGIIVQYLKITE